MSLYIQALRQERLGLSRPPVERAECPSEQVWAV